MRASRSARRHPDAPHLDAADGLRLRKKDVELDVARHALREVCHGIQVYRRFVARALDRTLRERPNAYQGGCPAEP
jgi:hypothetical protein